MSGRIAKSQIPVRYRATLPVDAMVALIEAKNMLRAGRTLRSFKNERGNSPVEGPPLPDPAMGCAYFEKQVGSAHSGDPKGQHGSKRLIFEVNSSTKQILEVYYTEEHYGKFTFQRVI